jgi:hypothetical protein
MATGGILDLNAGPSDRSGVPQGTVSCGAGFEEKGAYRYGVLKSTFPNLKSLNDITIRSLNSHDEGCLRREGNRKIYSKLIWSRTVSCIIHYCY